MFRTLANMRAKRHGQTDDAPHLAVKTASLAPFHRDFAPPHIISYVGTNIAYYIGMSGTQTKTGGGEMKCSESGCRREATHILTQKQLGRVKPCRPLATCEKHTPEWARKIGDGETKYYTVESLCLLGVI